MRETLLRRSVTPTQTNRPARALRVGLATLTTASVLLAGAGLASAGAPLTNGQWIAKSRVLIAGNPAFEDGSVSQHPKAPLETVSPYWGNYAAIGLANAGGTVKVRLAEDWLKWYRGKVKGSGVISKCALDPQGTDPESYTASPTGSENDVNTDSPAAYAGSYLLAMWAYRQAAGANKIKNHKKQIRHSAFLLLRQLDSADGLVWSHPNGTSGRMKSLITQAESYAALRAATIMLSDVGYANASSLAAAGADAIRVGSPRCGCLLRAPTAR